MPSITTRQELGQKTFREVMRRPPGEPSSVLDRAAIEFAFAEVWSRPGLSMRDRRLIALTCACTDRLPESIHAHARAALESGDFDLAELHELVLHIAVYIGFPPLGTVARMQIDTAAEDLGIDPPDVPPFGEVEDRRALGIAVYQEVNSTTARTPDDLLKEASFDFTCAEVWARPGLSRRARRIASIACMVRDGLDHALSIHVRSALEAGELTEDEFGEFALQLAVAFGFARASQFRSVIASVICGSESASQNDDVASAGEMA